MTKNASSLEKKKPAKRKITRRHTSPALHRTFVCYYYFLFWIFLFFRREKLPEIFHFITLWPACASVTHKIKGTPLNGRVCGDVQYTCLCIQYVCIGVCVYIQGDYLDVWNTTSVLRWVLTYPVMIIYYSLFFLELFLNTLGLSLTSFPKNNRKFLFFSPLNYGR